MSVTFEWDSAKALANISSHGVEFEEACTAFTDVLSLTRPDQEHSELEDRWVLMGLSERGRLVVVVHTDRGDRIRLISARLATRQERRQYEES